MNESVVDKKPFSCQPYLLNRNEFKVFLELHHPDGASQGKAIKGSAGKMMQRAKLLEWLSFGVHPWLFKKAVAGDSEALFKLEYGYDLFTEVKAKAKEEGLL